MCAFPSSGFAFLLSAGGIVPRAMVLIGFGFARR
jgi:hypothetical protein